MDNLKPYQGPPLFLTGGFIRSQGGQLRFSAPTGCNGGVCSSKPSPASAFSIAQSDETLDPTKLYSARAESCATARANPVKSKQSTDIDPFTTNGVANIYAARH